MSPAFSAAELVAPCQSRKPAECVQPHPSSVTTNMRLREDKVVKI